MNIHIQRVIFIGANAIANTNDCDDELIFVLGFLFTLRSTETWSSADAGQDHSLEMTCKLII